MKCYDCGEQYKDDGTCGCLPECQGCKEKDNHVDMEEVRKIYLTELEKLRAVKPTLLHKETVTQRIDAISGFMNKIEELTR